MFKDIAVIGGSNVTSEIWSRCPLQCSCTLGRFCTRLEPRDSNLVGHVILAAASLGTPTGQLPHNHQHELRLIKC
jgi:hypothetical protein